MKSSLSLLTVLLLTGGLVATAAGQETDARNNQALEQTLRELFPEEAVEFDERTPIEMRVATESMIDRTLEPGRITTAFTQLSRVNRNALGELSEQHAQTLERELQAFERAFEARYGQPMNIQKSPLLEGAPTVRALVRDADAITRLPYRPIAPPHARDTARTQPNETDQAQPAAAGRQPYGASAKTYGIDDDSKIGVLALPAKGGIPDLIVTAVEESRPGAGDMAGDWRVIIPLQVRADTIAVNVAQHLRNLRQRQDDWPENPQETREIVARRVLMSYYNINPRGQPGNTQSGNQQQTPRQQQQQHQQN